MLRLGTIAIGVDDVDEAAGFWCAVLGYEPVRFDGAEDGWTILRPPSGEGTRLAVHRTTTPVQDRPRMHLDLIVDDREEQVAEIERLLSLGATRVAWDYPQNPDFVVLADPAGNRFCVVDASAA